MDYKEKYIKYKIKYLELSNQINNNKQKGGYKDTNNDLIKFIKNEKYKTIRILF